MRRLLIWTAVAIVLVANTWALLSAWQNRRVARGGTLELTERELRLAAMPLESTVVLLHLEWDVLSGNARNQGPPQWLDAKKLAELGFDCTLPVTNAYARRFYNSMSATPVFLVLEYQGDAWRQAPAQRNRKTRLFVVDAGRDPQRLRTLFPDTTRYALARGLVRPFLQIREGPDDPPLAVPRLRGWIQLLPGQIFVPLPYGRLLQPFVSHDLSGREQEERDPRFAVTVSWGAHYEPWITAVRPLTTETPVEKAK